MNFLNIKYFIAIAEEQNISAAARKLYVSQQSLSEHLKKLETEIGAPLFIRGNTITLTVAGECFLDGAKEIMASYNRMISNISHNMRGVDLYISYLPVPEELEDVCIMDSNPYCVSFHKDLALKIYGNDWPALEKQLQESHDLSLLKAMPFILLYDRHGQLTQDLDSIFNEYGFSPTPGFTSENGHLNIRMCQKGFGCMLAPKNTVQYYFSAGKEASDMLCYPISVTSFPTYQAICYKKGLHLHPAEICFINEARAFLSGFTKN